jgi:hypothetical protein
MAVAAAAQEAHDAAFKAAAEASAAAAQVSLGTTKNN